MKSIAEAFRNNQSVLGIFSDLSKAFDTIDHIILLPKSKHYGWQMLGSVIVCVEDLNTLNGVILYVPDANLSDSISHGLVSASRHRDISKLCVII